VIEYISLITLLMCGFGTAEFFSHRKKIFKIPFRIHVSGTRGKSSVTRLLHSGLSHSGIKTSAKTTGTLARMILPDGLEVPVFRPAGSNIIEQKRIIDVSSSFNVEAIVLECMALQPEYHWVCEEKFIKATHGVITNIRADHLDVMGPSVEDVAKSIAGMIPVKGKLYTAERKYLDILKRAAEDRGTKLITVSEDEINSITKEEMAGFPYVEHAENVALAIKILEDFGISRDNAIRAMWKANPDPGVLTEHELDFFGRQIVFVNAFAANDLESTEKIWNLMTERYSFLKKKIAVLNLRDDRPARTSQMAKDTRFWQNADNVVLIGRGAYLFSRLISEAGINQGKFIFGEQDSLETVFEKIIEASGDSALVVGMGNIGGLGLPLTRYFKNREKIGSIFNGS